MQVSGLPCLILCIQKPGRTLVNHWYQLHTKCDLMYFCKRNIFFSPIYSTSPLSRQQKAAHVGPKTWPDFSPLPLYLSLTMKLLSVFMFFIYFLFFSFVLVYFFNITLYRATFLSTRSN